MSHPSIQQLRETPSWVGARFLPDGAQVEAVTTTNEYSTFTRVQQRLSLSLASASSTPAVAISSDVILSSISTTGSSRIEFVKRDGALFLAVTVKNVLAGEVPLASHHSSIAVDPSFGGLGGKEVSWDSLGTRFLYTAEPVTTPDQQDDFLPNFGDSLLDRKRPQVWLGDISDPKKPTVTLLLESSIAVAFGQAVFVTDQSYVVAGYDSLADGRRTGIIYCQNILARLYLCEIEKEGKLSTPKVFTGEDRSARSARVAHGRIVYVSNAAGGAHASTVQLHGRAVPFVAEVQDDVIVKVISGVIPRDEFPGLYLDQLPAYPYVLIDGSARIVLSSEWGSRLVPLLIDATSGKVGTLPDADPVVGVVGREKIASLTIFGTNTKDEVIAKRGFNASTEELLHLTIGEVEWTVLSPPSIVVESLTVATIPISEVSGTEVILITGAASLQAPLKTLASEVKNGISLCSGAPASQKEAGGVPPLILIPHGGPHMAHHTTLSYHYATLALSGYTVALVNFTGSTGFGEDALQELVGSVGKTDVKSLNASIDYLVSNKLASTAKGKLFCEGLSHGGFLTAHMTSKYPSLFTAATLRNPVVDVATMFLGTTDIPWWCLAESKIPHTMRELPTWLTVEQFALISASSPIYKVASVTTPSLILLSAADQRVIPRQGASWYHSLKLHGKAETECRLYQGEIHALDGVGADLRAVEATLEWYEKYVDWK